MIKATDYISTAFSAGDAEKMYDAVTKALETSNKVEIDFSDIEIFTTLFFNFAFAKILITIGTDKYNESISLVNLSELGEFTYTHSYDNAVRYYNLSEEERAKQDEINSTPDVD